MGDMKRRTEGRAGVAGGRLDPDPLEGPFGSQSRIRDAIQRHAAGHAEVGIAGPGEEPVPQFEEHFLEATLHGRGKVGVFIVPLLDLAHPRRVVLPANRIDTKAAIVADLHRLPEFVDVRRLSIARQRHHLVFIR